MSSPVPNSQDYPKQMEKQLKRHFEGYVLCVRDSSENPFMQRSEVKDYNE
jgi:hypothetical protein